ncbi:MAG: hypothetical protein U0271_08175 [Polyangiaceae bacterium]
MPQSPHARAWRRLFAAAALGPLILVLCGFDLDKGELKCEQAASKLAECCPDLDLGRLSCIQQGGCDRGPEGTLVSMEESDCIRASDCEDLASRDVCERIRARIESLEDPDGPTIQELYGEDPLCD